MNQNLNTSSTQQGCHNGHFWMKITIRMSARVRVYPTDGFLPSADAVKIRLRGRNPASAQTLEKKNFKILFLFKKIFLVVVAGLKRRKKISVFGFLSPNSPSSAGEAARRRRFFRPSSPSHPSKLYSSLGWLNSKVPKPFPPFSLRLIDVDGF
jgi:hypothetical protein